MNPIAQVDPFDMTLLVKQYGPWFAFGFYIIYKEITSYFADRRADTVRKDADTAQQAAMTTLALANQRALENERSLTRSLEASLRADIARLDDNLDKEHTAHHQTKENLNALINKSDAQTKRIEVLETDKAKQSETIDTLKQEKTTLEAALRTEIGNLQDQITSLTSQLSAALTEQKSLEDLSITQNIQITELLTRNTSLTRANDELQQERDALAVTLAKMQGEIDSLRNELIEMRAAQPSAALVKIEEKSNVEPKPISESAAGADGTGAHVHAAADAGTTGSDT